MKNTLSLLGVFILSALFSIAVAQEKQGVKKEVKMIEKDGVKTLTITTTKDGMATEERYTGEEAEKKMTELMGDKGQTEEVERDVKIEMIDGIKHLTLTTTTNGKMRQEVYVGEEAERKIKELEVKSEKKPERKIITREEVKKTSSDK